MYMSTIFGQSDKINQSADKEYFVLFWFIFHIIDTFNKFVSLLTEISAPI